MSIEKIILGIDPGTSNIGVAVVKYIEKPNEMPEYHLLYAETYAENANKEVLALKKEVLRREQEVKAFNTPYKDRYAVGAFKLNKAREKLEKVFSTYDIDYIAFETPYQHRMVNSFGQTVGGATTKSLIASYGCITYILSMKPWVRSAGVFPQVLKRAVTGDGKADKFQVAEGVFNSLASYPEDFPKYVFKFDEEKGLTEDMNRKLKIRGDHATDAIAAVIAVVESGRLGKMESKG